MKKMDRERESNVREANDDEEEEEEEEEDSENVN